MSSVRRTIGWGMIATAIVAFPVSLLGDLVAAETAFRSHPPMRPLPVPAPKGDVPADARVVDAGRGDDAAAGTLAAPWKTLRHAVRQLRAGETLLVRGGVYYEKFALTRSGEENRPIIIRAFPGELPVVDGGLREFAEHPESSWEPLPGGAEGEFVSTRAYPHADTRVAPKQFLPNSWEPFWGIEEERPLALGNFLDSMVPLHGYRIAVDLKASNELWVGNKKEMRDTGLYGGPGLWFNRDTGRVHIRLAHHQLAGLGNRAYRGETDPRKLPLCIAVGFGEEVLRLTGVRHVIVQDLVFRGATGSPMIRMYGCENVGLERITVYGGDPALLIDASRNVRVGHSGFRGLAAPWTSRAHMKYRGTPSYQLILQNNQPLNENIEFANCEFTDDHDFAFLRFVKNLQFHHNFVDNFNDDGLECGPKLRSHTLFIFQNRIGNCLIPLTQHEFDRDDSPIDHDPKAGLFVYRNVFDTRGGTYSSPPDKPDETGAFLRREGHLLSDHGSPIYPVIHCYHNTFLRQGPNFRDYFLFGLGAAGMRWTEREVFNNLFVQMERTPGAGFAGITEAGALREGGNILWGIQDDGSSRDVFKKFQASKLFAESRKQYEPGWTTQDRVEDPKFVRLNAEKPMETDLRLSKGSPAIDAGLPIPPEWPDPLRAHDAGTPDIGAIPWNVAVENVGIYGRISLFSGALEKGKE